MENEEYYWLDYRKALKSTRWSLFSLPLGSRVRVVHFTRFFSLFRFLFLFLIFALTVGLPLPRSRSR
jgi:hypothetical protein